MLQALWKRQPATVAEVRQELGGRHAYTTMLTVLSRLHAKGLLEREKESRGYRYRLQAAARPAPRGLFERLKRQIFADNSAEAISYLLSGLDDLSQKDVMAIEKILEKYRRKPC